MPSPMVTVDGFGVPVEVAGPEKGSVVVLLAAAQKTPWWKRVLGRE